MELQAMILAVTLVVVVTIGLCTTIPSIYKPMDRETDEQYLYRTHEIKETGADEFMFREKTTGLWATLDIFDSDLTESMKCTRTTCYGIRCRDCFYSGSNHSNDTVRIHLVASKLKRRMSLKEKFQWIYGEKYAY